MGYELDGDFAPSLFVPAGLPAAAKNDRRRKSQKLDAGAGAAAKLQCALPPTDTPKVSNTSYTLETDQALQLGINYVATGNLDIDKRMKVFVREYAKYDTCESTDGKATLRYGAVWRATVLIDQTDASGKINFAMVAASATLKNLSVEVSITHAGFAAADRDAIDVATAAAMAATANGLNVSSFVKFSEQVEKAVRAAMKAKVLTPLYYLGYEPHDNGHLQESVARTFALSYIARGSTCVEAIADFPVKSQGMEATIRETYDSLLSKPGDGADEMAQLKAQQLLSGIKVKLPFW